MRVIIDIDDATFTTPAPEHARARVARYLRNVAAAIEATGEDSGVVPLILGDGHRDGPHNAGWAIDGAPWHAVAAPESHQERRT